MKRKKFIKIAFLLSTVVLIVTCTKSDIEKAREAYDASKVIPIIQGLSGLTTVTQTFSYPYTVSGTTRAGSTIEWAVVRCTIDSLSKDTHTVYVKFGTVTDSAKVTVVKETTVGGAVATNSLTKTIKVNPYCPLAISGLVGTWGGTDGYGTGSQSFASQVVTTARNSTSVNIKDLNKGWMNDYWGETITAGGTVPLIINPDGSMGALKIEDQYFCTTDYNGDPYEYWIKGDGVWSNCGAKPTLTINYNIYYKDPANGGTYPSSSTKFTAALTLN
jgi:hypothetical protein